jgi:hypothetical protein
MFWLHTIRLVRHIFSIGFLLSYSLSKVGLFDFSRKIQCTNLFCQPNHHQSQLLGNSCSFASKQILYFFRLSFLLCCLLLESLYKKEVLNNYLHDIFCCSTNTLLVPTGSQHRNTQLLLFSIS